VAGDHLGHGLVDGLEPVDQREVGAGEGAGGELGLEEGAQGGELLDAVVRERGRGDAPESESWSAPSAARRRTASRAGVMETPNCLAMPRRVRGCPGATSPCMMRARRDR
jgi:hypothetical protein